MIKKVVTLGIIFILCSLTIYSQNRQDSIFKILIKFQSSFSTLSDTYEIDYKDKSIIWISPIRILPDTLDKRKKRHLSNKKWISLRHLIVDTKFETLESSESQGFDGGWYHIDIIYDKGYKKHIDIWIDSIPNSLIKIHEFLKMELK